MISTLKPTAEPQTALEPTVRYDVATATIHLTVMASPKPEDPGMFNVLAAPVSVPSGKWTMIWVLESTDPLDRAKFGKVELPPQPLPNVSITNSDKKTDFLWQADLDNRVTDFNGFSYFIHVVPEGSVTPVTRHDPSIAVTSDPITGPA